MKTDKEPIYPIEPWKITETSYNKENNFRNETTFSLSNGYLGTRGTYEESYDFDINTGLEGNFVNGFYEREQIRYGEANAGSPMLSQSLLNLPNLKKIKLYFEEEEFSMEQGMVEEYSRILHMKEGILTRSLIWTSPKGKRARIEIRRLVSFDLKNIMAICYQVTPLNFDGEIVFVSGLQADVENHTRKTNPIVDYGPFGRKLDPLKLYAEGTRLFYQGKTQSSCLSIACAAEHSVLSNTGNVDMQSYAGCLDAHLSIRIQGSAGETIKLEKMICYSSSLDHPAGELETFVHRTLEQAQKTGFEQLEQLQKKYFNQFWDIADIKIDGDNCDSLQQGMRFNLFHIIQSAGRDGRTGMGAKGLSGEGYEGHYFWDTEMYMLPVFVYTEPEVARHLLEYRYSTLEQARERARILGHEKGALFPWRTINGEEASTYFPLGTAQYHINADIAYAVSLYLQVTDDKEFFLENGAEILIETARVWADVGSFAECRGGKYCICSVTGPDEYNVLVDNNFYTNFMARENLRQARDAVRNLKKLDMECFTGLKQKIEFDEKECIIWEEIIEKMYFPFDEKRQVYPLDDGFLMRKPWDETKIPPENRSWLYEKYHPLFIMRHRMSKQADAILAMYLYNNLFTEEEIRRNYDFYQEVTLHHSSLSTCIFGIVASDIGYHSQAYQYFSQSVRMDLDDYHNNFYAGIHAANMAGSWQSIVNGFAGMRCHDSKLKFKPYLPEKWRSFTFRLRFKDAVLQVKIGVEGNEFRLIKGTGINFCVFEKEVSLNEERDVYFEKV